MQVSGYLRAVQDHATAQPEQPAALGQACLPTLEIWVSAAFLAGTDREQLRPAAHWKAGSCSTRQRWEIPESCASLWEFGVLRSFIQGSTGRTSSPRAQHPFKQPWVTHVPCQAGRAGYLIGSWVPGQGCGQVQCQVRICDRICGVIHTGSDFL